MVSDPKYFAIHSCLGVFVEQGEYRNTIDVSSLPNGVYLFNLISKSGQFSTNRFVVNKN